MLKVTYYINSIYKSRTYILSDSKTSDVWLVDCGDIPPLINMISSLCVVPFNIKGVLLTHIHYDHIYGLPRLTELFPDVFVYTNREGVNALANERINMSRYHEDPINFDSENVIVCEDGDEILLFDGICALVHYTPGHNVSCLTYEIGDYLFTGDTYIPGLKVVTNLPGGNKLLAIESVELIESLAKDKIVCAGHDV